MDLGLLARGVAFGVAIAAPVGPIGVLCIRRTLAYGRAVGMASGLGAATADLTYGLVTAFGVTAVTGPLTRNATPLKVVGGLALVVIAWRIARSVPPDGSGVDVKRSVWPAYLSAYGLTLANPATIAVFLALFASLGATDDPLPLAVGVGIGSALWWLVLAAGVGFFRHRLTPRRLRAVNVTSGLALAVFGGASVLASLA